MARAAISSSKFSLSIYLSIARIQRWPLNLFILPGAILSAMFGFNFTALISPEIIIAFIALCCIAFANYSINEYLDAPFDALHPEKCERAGAEGLLQLRFVLLVYGILAATGLGLACVIGHAFFLVLTLLLLMGIFYNTPPIRTKDKPYLDILSESVNNPLRFLAGWFVIPHATFPPITIVLCCWMAGAFLMTMKRYAEYRHINDPKTAKLYRASFRYYNEEKLLHLAYFFMLTSSFFMSAFLSSYSSLLLLTFPFYALLFTWYIKIASSPNSSAQHSDQIFKREPKFILTAVLVGVATIVLFYVHILLPHLNLISGNLG